MSFSVRPGVSLVVLITLLTLPEQGFPQCYAPNFRNTASVAPTCCAEVSTASIKETIAFCFEQPETTIPGCNVHAFIFITVNNNQYCVDPASPWLKRRFQILENKGICCRVL